MHWVCRTFCVKKLHTKGTRHTENSHRKLESGFGLEGSESNHCLSFSNVRLTRGKSSPKFKKIMEISHPPHSPEGITQQSSTQELLLALARKLFAAKGYAGTTVKDVADDAQANVSLVSYYFGGKEGLYRACFEQIGTAKLRQARDLLQPAQSAEEFRVRLTLLCRDIFDAHQDNPNLHAMIHRECESPEPIVEDIFKRTFLKVWEELERFIASAQSLGIVRGEIDPSIAATQFLLGLLQMAKLDTLNFRFFGKTLKDSEYRTHVTQQIVQLFLKGTSA